ncbi:MAG: DUF433 domain-containing protein [Symploca sp. SIO2C1]|nr:DUF433 domain-containing protein [Symploca sp. SIO2C1]
MATITDIGKLITTNSQLRGGRPLIAGTGTSVRRVAGLYKQGYSAEEIARRLNHLTITQIYASLAYFHANREEIEQDLAEEQQAYEQLAALHYQKNPNLQ